MVTTGPGTPLPPTRKAIIEGEIIGAARMATPSPNFIAAVTRHSMEAGDAAYDDAIRAAAATPAAARAFTDRLMAKALTDIALETLSEARSVGATIDPATETAIIKTIYDSFSYAGRNLEVGDRVEQRIAGLLATIPGSSDSIAAAAGKEAVESHRRLVYELQAPVYDDIRDFITAAFDHNQRAAGAAPAHTSGSWLDRIKGLVGTAAARVQASAGGTPAGGATTPPAPAASPAPAATTAATPPTPPAATPPAPAGRGGGWGKRLPWGIIAAIGIVAGWRWLDPSFEDNKPKEDPITRIAGAGRATVVPTIAVGGNPQSAATIAPRNLPSGASAAAAAPTPAPQPNKVTIDLWGKEEIRLTRIGKDDFFAESVKHQIEGGRLVVRDEIKNGKPVIGSDGRTVVEEVLVTSYTNASVGKPPSATELPPNAAAPGGIESTLQNLVNLTKTTKGGIEVRPGEHLQVYGDQTNGYVAVYSDLKYKTLIIRHINPDGTNGVGARVTPGEVVVLTTPTANPNVTATISGDKVGIANFNTGKYFDGFEGVDINGKGVNLVIANANSLSGRPSATPVDGVGTEIHFGDNGAIVTNDAPILSISVSTSNAYPLSDLTVPAIQKALDGAIEELAKTKTKTNMALPQPNGSNTAKLGDGAVIEYPAFEPGTWTQRASEERQQHNKGGRGAA